LKTKAPPVPPNLQKKALHLFVANNLYHSTRRAQLLTLYFVQPKQFRSEVLQSCTKVGISDDLGWRISMGQLSSTICKGSWCSDQGGIPQFML